MKLYTETYTDKNIYFKQKLISTSIILNDFLFFILILKEYLNLNNLLNTKLLITCILILNKFLVKYIFIFNYMHFYINYIFKNFSFYNLQLFSWQVSFLKLSASNKHFLKNVQQRVLLIKKISRTRKKGRVRRYKIIVIIGNKTGWIGIGSSKDYYLQEALKKAKKQAFKNMYYIPVTYSKQLNTPYLTLGDNTRSICLSSNDTKLNISRKYIIRVFFEMLGVYNINSKIKGNLNPYNIIDLLLKLSNES